MPIPESSTSREGKAICRIKRNFKTQKRLSGSKRKKGALVYKKVAPYHKDLPRKKEPGGCPQKMGVKKTSGEAVRIRPGGRNKRRARFLAAGLQKGIRGKGRSCTICERRGRKEKSIEKFSRREQAHPPVFRK